MAVIHIKNIHNHKIKAGFRNEPLPPYFDGYVDTLSGNIVDPISNVDSFLQSVKSEIDNNINRLTGIVESSDDKLKTALDEIAKRNEEYKAIADSNNATLIEYVFGNTDFSGKKEVLISNGSELKGTTAKFAKSMKITVNWPITRRTTTGSIIVSGLTAYFEMSKNGDKSTNTYSETITVPFTERGLVDVSTVFGRTLKLDFSNCSDSKIDIGYALYSGSTNLGRPNSTYTMSPSWEFSESSWTENLWAKTGSGRNAMEYGPYDTTVTQYTNYYMPSLSITLIAE